LRLWLDCLAARKSEIGGKIERLAELLATAPARIFGLSPRKGVVAPGSDADLVVWDPNVEWTVEDERSPYLGLRLQGRIRAVISRGAPLVDGGEWVGGKPDGRYLAVNRPATNSPVPVSGPT
jgi:dihydropyrimidinase